MNRRHQQRENNSKVDVINEIRREQELYNQKEYEEIKKKFVDGVPKQDQIDDLKRLAGNGVREAAYGFAHFATSHLEYSEQAIAFLKYYKSDLYANHLQGVLAWFQGDEDTALYFFLKNAEKRFGTSMIALHHLMYESPELKSYKNAQRIDNALEAYYRDYHCC